MKEVWNLPNLESLKCNDKEWLLHMLDQKSKTECMLILMTLWRILHARNEVVHHKPMPTIECSKRFLCSYAESLLMIKQSPQADTVKGKAVVPQDHLYWEEGKKKVPRVQPPKPWIMPTQGRVKLNVDGSFSASDGNGGAGMMLRDENSVIIVSACRFLSSCNCPLEAELESCREGIAMALEWSSLPCSIEMDCTEAVKMIKQPGIDRSQFAGIASEIKQLLLSVDRFEIESNGRGQNNVSHVLANFGRRC